MLGSAMMKVAESGRFAERRELISHFVTEFIRSESQRGSNPLRNIAEIEATVLMARIAVDRIEEAAHGR